jgi:TolA-binding protein
MMRAALLGLLLAGCMTTGQGRELSASMGARVDEVLRTLREAKSAAEKRLAAIEKQLADNEQLLRRSSAESFQKFQQLQLEATKLAGRLDELERTIELQKRELELMREPERQRQRLTAPTTTDPGNDPEAAYFAAVKEFSLGHFHKAIDLFLATWQRYPKHERLPEIQLGIAEAYLALKDYQRALAEFRRFYLDFTSHPKAPEALFRAAECFESLRDTRKAILALRLLRLKFKDSSFAKEAAKMMSRLGSR